jgi:hypothetical protein
MTLESIALVVGLWVLVCPAVVIALLSRVTRPSRHRLDPRFDLVVAVRPVCERRYRASRPRVPRRERPEPFSS